MSGIMERGFFDRLRRTAKKKKKKKSDDSKRIERSDGEIFARRNIRTVRGRSTADGSNDRPAKERFMGEVVLRTPEMSFRR